MKCEFKSILAFRIGNAKSQFEFFQELIDFCFDKIEPYYVTTYDFARNVLHTSFPVIDIYLLIMHAWCHWIAFQAKIAYWIFSFWFFFSSIVQIYELILSTLNQTNKKYQQKEQQERLIHIGNP